LLRPNLSEEGGREKAKKEGIKEICPASSGTVPLLVREGPKRQAEGDPLKLFQVDKAEEERSCQSTRVETDSKGCRIKNYLKRKRMITSAYGQIAEGTGRDKEKGVGRTTEY